MAIVEVTSLEILDIITTFTTPVRYSPYIQSFRITVLRMIIWMKQSCAVVMIMCALKSISNRESNKFRNHHVSMLPGSFESTNRLLVVKNNRISDNMLSNIKSFLAWNRRKKFLLILHHTQFLLLRSADTYTVHQKVSVWQMGFTTETWKDAFARSHSISNRGST